MNRAALASLSLLITLAACATPVVAPPPVVRIAPPPPGLDRILGASVATVTALLGAASLDRTEGPARQLQFVRPPCVLDVFFYPAPNNGPLAVRTAAARRYDGSRIDPGTCLTLIAPPAVPAATLAPAPRR